MALPIEWSKEAEITYLNIVISIGEKWTEREVKNFIERTEQVLYSTTKQISYDVSLFQNGRRSPGGSKQTYKPLLQNDCSKNNIVEL